MKLSVKFVSIFLGVLLPIVAVVTIQDIKRETRQQQDALQEVLTKQCPLMWANIDKVRAMPQYAEVKKWCPEA